MNHGPLWVTLLWCLSQTVGESSTSQVTDHVVLDCTSKGPIISVTWNRRSERSSSIESSQEAITPESLGLSSCCALRQSNDKGAYVCLPGPANHENDSVQLQMQHEELSSRLEEGLQVVVTCQGTEVVLFCDDQNGNALWRRGPRHYPGPTLTLKDVQKADGGIYTCQVKFDNRKATLVKELLLVVEFAPVITLPRREVHLEELLICLVESSPEAHVTWLKDDVPLEDEAYQTAVEPAINCTLRATLLIRAFNGSRNGSLEENEANYTCLAENKHGRSSAVLNLIARPETSSEPEEIRRFNVTGFIIGMLPPLCISFYIIVKLGYRSRYAEERGEEDGVREEPFFVSY